MKVSLYSKYNAIAPIKSLSIYKALDAIMNGTYKEQVQKARFNFNQPETYKIEKLKLPLIGWSGTFTTRSNNNLIKFSGFASLDFDKIEDINKLITQVNNDKYTFASFLTPSGVGLKVLVKIPPVSSDVDYKGFYRELQKHYDQYAKTDESTKDISRASFVSYDPNLFVNNDSLMFTDKFIPKVIETKKVTVKIEDSGEVANRLITWFSKKWRSGQERNNNLFILCSSFNDYGVDKSTALDYCLGYVESDFKDDEIKSIVNSAYKKSENFGTKAFEDKKKIKTIKKMAMVGASKEQIKNKVGDDNIDDIIDELTDDIDNDIFWEVDDKGKINISFLRFDRYLKSKGISKYFHDKESESFEFVTKDDDFINWISPKRIKDLVKKDLISNGHNDVWDLMAGNARYFSSEYLSMLDTIDISHKRDTKTESFLYYRNTAIKTTAQNIELLSYDSINDLIWTKQVIDRDINLSDNSEGIFKTFIWKVSGEDVERYYTLKSVIGYLLHSYQNDAKPKAIIFNDEMISDDVPNGGSGKGLIHKAIGHIKNVVTEDGKRFDPKAQFAYQKVNKDTQIFLMDDVSKHFSFESLFSIVTEGMTVEKKGKDSFQIPFNESPKLSITTNYTVKGEGASFYRRVFEVEIANYFNDKYTPEDEFKHQFFSEWDELEWQRFDNFMIRCIQYFLKNGLVESNKVNLDLRKLRNSLGAEFIEFIESKDLTDLRISRQEMRQDFNNIYKTVARFNSPQKFNKKVKDYCEFYGIECSEKSFNGAVNFYFKDMREKTENNNKEEDEIEF